MTEKQSLPIKPGPWFQFVGLMLLVGGLLLAARGHESGQLLGLVAFAVSIGGFIFARIDSPKPTSDVLLRFWLQVGGYLLAGTGITLLGPELDLGLTFGYFGIGVNFAGLFYDSLYP